MSEADLDRAVRALAQRCGWDRYHTFSSRRSPQGFPDLLLCRPPRVVFAELKSERGRLTPHQEHWLDLLRRCPGIEVYLWRPSDFDRIVKTLSPRYGEGPP